MDKMVDHLFVFQGEGEIKDILGNYTGFRKQQQEQAREQKREEVKPQEEVKTAPKTNDKRKLSFKEKMEFEQLEKDMESLEAEKDTLTAQLSDTNLPGDELMKIGERLSEVVSSLDEKTDRWLELSEFV
jgi:ATP-binding cassette subfamily F protein uup